MQLLLASGNVKKRAELEALLAPLGLSVLVPVDVGGLPAVDEDQDTFAANACKKAASGACASGLWCLADDSGLEVDALGGRPGVHSARYAGEHGDDRANNAKLLDELAGVAPKDRTARFRCALALARPPRVPRTRQAAASTGPNDEAGDEAGENAEIAFVVEGCAEGRIAAAPRGEAGFGYDPLFEFRGDGPNGDLAARVRGRTFAELSSAEKASVSHRGRALVKFAAQVEGILREVRT